MSSYILKKSTTYGYLLTFYPFSWPIITMVDFIHMYGKKYERRVTNIIRYWIQLFMTQEFIKGKSPKIELWET